MILTINNKEELLELEGYDKELNLLHTDVDTVIAKGVDVDIMAMSCNIINFGEGKVFIYIKEDIRGHKYVVNDSYVSSFTCSNYRSDVQILAKGEINRIGKGGHITLPKVFKNFLINHGELVETINDGCFFKKQCRLLTDGEKAGEYAHKDGVYRYLVDAETEKYRYWLDSEEPPEDLVRVVDGTFKLKEDCVQLTHFSCNGEWEEAGFIAFLDGYSFSSRHYRRDIVRLYNEEFAHRDDSAYIESEDEWYLRTECVYSECCDSWTLQETSCDCGTRVRGYHGSPNPYFYLGVDNKGSLSDDFDVPKIGFEVEKTRVLGATGRGDFVGEYPLFAGWEEDSSCGVEGISNVYALNDEGEKAFLAHVEASKELLNEPANSTCGGHVNLSGDGINYQSIKKFAPLIYAMYRFRLNNSYSRTNKSMKDSNRTDGYQPIKCKGRLVEVRLVSAVRSSEQIVFRYKFFRRLVESIQAGDSLADFLGKVKELLLTVYTEENLKSLYELACDFNDYLNVNGKISDRIKEYDLPDNYELLADSQVDLGERSYIVNSDIIEQIMSEDYNLRDSVEIVRAESTPVQINNN